MTEVHLRETLDRMAETGDKIRLWLRDDDAVEPSGALDRLLELTAARTVPTTLAVIPEHTGAALAHRLETAPQVSVAVHGWSHRNYAPEGEKKQELGPHRPAETVLAELKAGFDKLSALHTTRFIPMLVPPWNRIAATLLPQLTALGFTSLSVFGQEREGSPIPLVNTHIDVIDWHGTRGGRPTPELLGELAEWVGGSHTPPAIGVLTHHLVHDEAAWDFLEALFAITVGHPACEWIRPDEF